MSVADTRAVMDAYCEAYEAANGHAFTDKWAYEHGWFVLKHPDGTVWCRYRRKALVEMTERLRARAEEAV